MNVDSAIERLRELRAEYATGEARLRDLQEEQVRVRDSMLRIDGAIQVLEEMIRETGTFAARAEQTNGEAVPTPR